MSELIDCPAGSTLLLGAGYDFVRRETKLSPLHPFEKISEPTGSLTTDLSFVEHAAELSSFLKVGAEGAYDSPAFHASLKSEFVQQTQINEYSLLFVVHCACAKQVDLASGIPGLNADALAMLRSGQLGAFRQSFGDHYIEALTRGGELFGVVQITTRSQRERESLKAELNAGGVSWSARGSFESKVSRSSSQVEIRLHTSFSGMPIADLKNPTTVGELFALVEQFPAKVAAAGTVVKALLRPIGDLPEYQQPTTGFDDPARQALAMLGDQFLEHTLLLNNLDFIVSHPDRFAIDSVPLPEVQAYRPQVQARLREIEQLSLGVISGTLAADDARIAAFPSAQSLADTLRLPGALESFTPPDIGVFPLRFNTAGDAEMDGHSPLIDIDAVLTSPDQRTLALQVHVKMKENKADWTTFEDNWPPAPSAAAGAAGQVSGFDLRHTGLQIVDFRPRSGALHAQAGHNDHDWHTYKGTGLIASADCLSDINGKETGHIGARTIRFNPVQLVLGPLPRPRGALPRAALAAAPPDRLSLARRDSLQFWAAPSARAAGTP
jgi:hypothetical protein